MWRPAPTTARSRTGARTPGPPRAGAARSTSKRSSTPAAACAETRSPIGTTVRGRTGADGHPLPLGLGPGLEGIRRERVLVQPRAAHPRPVGRGGEVDPRRRRGPTARAARRVARRRGPRPRRGRSHAGTSTAARTRVRSPRPSAPSSDWSRARAGRTRRSRDPRCSGTRPRAAPARPTTPRRDLQQAVGTEQHAQLREQAVVVRDAELVAEADDRGLLVRLEVHEHLRLARDARRGSP